MKKFSDVLAKAILAVLTGTKLPKDSSLRGLVLVDKPVGLTSHDVVSKLRKIYGLRRIGHAGTLDPEATGLLVVGLGNITRLLDYFQAKTKTYIGEVVFGIETDSYDSSGSVVATYEMGDIDPVRLSQAIGAMRGNISQVPPIVSALKVDGKKLYQYHREASEVDIKARWVKIDAFDYSILSGNVIQIKVVCGPGTYIRSIAHDLGVTMGGGAHLRNLRRISSGQFDVEEALTIEQLDPECILDPTSALRDFVLAGVDESLATRARNGDRVTLVNYNSDEVILFEKSDPLLVSWDQLIGLYRRESGDVYRASVVLPANS